MPANAETARRKGPERLSPEQKTIDIVRVFPWAVAMADRVAEDLEHGVEPCLIRVLLGRKSDESVISPNMLTPIGGKRRSEHGETKLDAAYRETEEESTIALFPWINDGKSKELIHVSSQNFTYAMDPEPVEYLFHCNTGSRAPSWRNNCSSPSRWKGSGFISKYINSASGE